MVNRFDSNIKKELKKDIPSATEDSADVTSRYEKYKKENKKSQFQPVKYEKPPHY